MQALSPGCVTVAAEYELLTMKKKMTTKKMMT